MKTNNIVFPDHLLQAVASVPPARPVDGRQCPHADGGVLRFQTDGQWTCDQCNHTYRRLPRPRHRCVESTRGVADIY